MYTPIIRNRQSETLALKELAADVRANTIPLLDLAAPAKHEDVAAVRAYVERNIKRTKKVLSKFDSALVDSSELDSGLRIGRSHPLLVAAREIASVECVPIPVTGLHRNAAHMSAALEVRESISDGVICFRLDATDISTSASSLRQLTQIMSSAGIPGDDVIVLLDLQSTYGKSVDPLVTQINRLLANFGGLEWRGVIVSGYGVPDQLSDAVGVRDEGYLPRVEQEVFSRVRSTNAIRNIWFGDYTTLSPTHVEMDWRVVSKVMSPKAVYALADSWFVIRGGPFSTHKDGYKQYHAIAREIVALGEFSGRRFSEGDAYVYEIATNALASSGSPSSWITACANHHISLTARAHAI